MGGVSAYCCGRGEDAPMRGLKSAEGPEAEHVVIAMLESQLKGFTLELHSATLIKPSKRHGSLKVYALLYRDGKPVVTPGGRTQAIESLNPEWEHKHVFQKVPHSIGVSLWAKKGWLQKDLFIGKVTWPCSPDMHLDKQRLQIERKGKITATVCVTIQAELEETDSSSHSDALRQLRIRRQSTLLGGELDQLVDHLHGGKTWMAISLEAALQEGASDEEDDNDLSPSGQELSSLGQVRSTPAPDFDAHALLGRWKCTATHGLEDFLKKSGVGMFQRKMALAAAWPKWEFVVEEHTVTFKNHSAIGLLEEKLTIGKPYKWIDGKGNGWSCEAKWAETQTGGTLTIQRRGSLGDYEEIRTVDGDKLDFTLNNPTFNASWGRSFAKMLL